LCGHAEANGRETRRTVREGSAGEKQGEGTREEGKIRERKGEERKQSKKLRFEFLPPDFANGGLVSLL
jgi:hypothetical protein